MAALAEFIGLEHVSFEGLRLPVTIRLSEPVSDDELLAFSQRNRPYRIERNADGELEVMSPLGMDGGRRELFVMRVLGNWAEEHGGVCVSSNAGFKLPNNAVRSPDASWVSQSRVDALTEDQRRRFAPVCPEFLVEILSESDRRTTLEAKMKMWMGNGAELAWMIDPFAATISIYRPGATTQVLTRPDWVEAETVVTGFRLQTSRLWVK